MIDPEAMDDTLDAAGLDGVIVRSPTNAYYFSGIKSVAHDVFDEHLFGVWSRAASKPFLVMPTRETDLLVDSDIDPSQVYPYGGTNLYRGESLTESQQELLAFQEGRTFDDPYTAVRTALDEQIDGERIGVERSAFSPDRFDALREALSAYELQDADALLHQTRRVKTDEEVARIREAADITESAMHVAMDQLEPGMSERELARIYQRSIADRGAEPVFTTVGFGDHTCYTHPKPGDREIHDGDLVRWDAGVRWEGYVSDIGRTFAFGSSERKQDEIYDALYAGQRAALEALEAGTTTEEPYRRGIEAVRESGVDELEGFDPIHLGHGIGLEVYDPPRIEAADHEIQENMIFCVEPPYNKLGLGGFLIEDEVLVTEDGYEPFTDAPDHLHVFE